MKKFIKSIVAVTLSVCMLMSTAVFAKEDFTLLQFQSKTAIVGVGETITLGVNTSPALNGVGVWSVEDSGTCTVTNNGAVTGVMAGVTNVTVTCDGISATCTVTVKAANPTPDVKPDLTNIGVTAMPASMTVGDNFDLVCAPVPSNAILPPVTFTSSDNTVLEVTGNKMTAMKKGTANITASVPYGLRMITAVYMVTIHEGTKPDVKPGLKEFRMTNDKNTLAVGEFIDLVCVPVPAEAVLPTVTYTSSDNNIVKVVGNRITAVAEGTVTFTASVPGSGCIIVCEGKITVSGTFKPDVKLDGKPTSTPNYSTPTPTVVTRTVDEPTGIKIEVGKGVTNVTNPYIVVSPLPNWSQTYTDVSKAATNLNIDKVFDISLYDNNVKITQIKGGMVRVEIPFAAVAGTKYTMLRYNDDKTITQLATTFSDGKLTFDTDHFSIYAVASNAVKVTATKLIASKPTTVPKTGDTSSIGLVIALAIASICLGALALGMRRKEFVK